MVCPFLTQEITRVFWLMSLPLKEKTSRSTKDTFSSVVMSIIQQYCKFLCSGSCVMVWGCDGRNALTDAKTSSRRLQLFLSQQKSYHTLGLSSVRLIAKCKTGYEAKEGKPYMNTWGSCPAVKDGLVTNIMETIIWMLSVGPVLVAWFQLLAPYWVHKLVLHTHVFRMVYICCIKVLNLF